VSGRADKLIGNWLSGKKIIAAIDRADPYGWEAWGTKKVTQKSRSIDIHLITPKARREALVRVESDRIGNMTITKYKDGENSSEGQEFGTQPHEVPSSIDVFVDNLENNVI